MAALRNDNFDEYLELIKKEKNNRLTHIIQQTNRYLSSLGKKIMVQKEETGALSKAGVSHMTEEGKVEEQ